MRDSVDPDAVVLTTAKIPVFLWDGNGATEDRVFADLPSNATQVLVNLAFEQLGADCVRNQILSLGGVSVTGDSVDEWFAITGEAQVRAAIGKAAKKGKVEGGTGWFKNVTLGFVLGEVVGNALPKIEASPLAAKLKEVETWIYG